MTEDSFVRKIRKDRENDEVYQKTHDVPADVKVKLFRNLAKNEKDTGPRPLRFDGAYAVVRCSTVKSERNQCKGLMIVKFGQKTSKCPKCKKRKKLEKCTVMESFDSHHSTRREYQRLKSQIQGQ